MTLEERAEAARARRDARREAKAARQAAKAEAERDASGAAGEAMGAVVEEEPMPAPADAPVRLAPSGGALSVINGLHVMSGLPVKHDADLTITIGAGRIRFDGNGRRAFHYAAPLAGSAAPVWVPIPRSKKRIALTGVFALASHPKALELSLMMDGAVPVTIRIGGPQRTLDQLERAYLAARLGG